MGKRGKQALERNRACRRPRDALGGEQREPVGTRAAILDAVDARDRNIVVIDDDGLACPDLAQIRAEAVLQAGYTGFFHEAIIARMNRGATLATRVPSGRPGHDRGGFDPQVPGEQSLSPCINRLATHIVHVPTEIPLGSSGSR